MTHRFIGDDAIEAVESVEIDSSFSELPGTSRAWPAQVVLLAMVFLGPEKKA